jgi:hypothetical protein
MSLREKPCDEPSLSATTVRAHAGSTRTRGRERARPRGAPRGHDDAHRAEVEAWLRSREGGADA